MELRSYNLAELAPPDIQAYLAEKDIVMVPIASMEQHGPHLPLATDTIQAASESAPTSATSATTRRTSSRPRPGRSPATLTCVESSTPGTPRAGALPRGRPRRLRRPFVPQSSS